MEVCCNAFRSSVRAFDVKRLSELVLGMRNEVIGKTGSILGDGRLFCIHWKQAMA